jgi:4-amino-4-deoxy-L-arabinose transferase-like glycosyltransferase
LTLPGARRAALRALRPALLVTALAAIGLYLVLAVLHLRYPFELEWMEGGMVDHVRRVLAGQKLYVKPSIDFTPYIYPPLWFYVAAAFAKVFGVGFFSARLLSLAASLGVIALVVRLVQRETGSLSAGLVSGGLFAATYRIGGFFYDLARIDSLFLLLLLAALYLVRFHGSPRSRVLAAVLFALAFFTKQPASLLLAPVALHLALVERRRALWLVVPALVLIGGGVWLLDRIHQGWFSYFALWLPRQHPWEPRMWGDFWVQDLMGPLAPSCLLALHYLVVEGAEGRRFYAFSVAGALAAAWSGRLHHGGYLNVMMPALALIAILFGLGLSAALARAAALPEPRRGNVEAFLFSAAIIQFAVLGYPLGPIVPGKVDREAGAQLLSVIRGASGDVFVPAHGYLSTLAGKRTFAHEMALRDVLEAGVGGAPGEELRAELRKALAERRFGAVLADSWWSEATIEGFYVKRKEVFTSEDAFWPITGYRLRPKGVYLPK